MSLAIEHFPKVFSDWRARYEHRDTRIELIHDIVTGNWAAYDPDEEELRNRSANYIQVAIEDTAEAGGLLPSLRVRPSRDQSRMKSQASRMERVGISYLEASKWDLMIPETIMQMEATGFGVWTITPDFEQRIPLIERRDSRTCYPEPGFRPGDAVRRCMFVRQVYLTQMPLDHQIMLQEFADTERSRGSEDLEITLVDYYDEDEYVLAALISNKANYFASQVSYIPVELERVSHGLSVCPVVIGSRFALDGEFRGQYDQVIEPLIAHSRLLGTMMDYADQAVFSDVWVKDLIGDMPWGGGGFIQLGPNGQIGRVPPAVSSLDVQRDLDHLENAIHIGGRYPKSRPGDVDQSIVSAKGIEAMAGVMNTKLRTYHTLLKHMLERSLRIAFEMDRKRFPGVKSAAGLLRNQEFMIEYDARRDIDEKHHVTIEYGLGLGRTASESAVLQIQYLQNEIISKELVQEGVEGVNDVGREQARIDAEQIRSIMWARTLQLSEAGGLPPEALPEMMKGRLGGQTVDELYMKYVVEPQQEQMSAATDPGLGAGPVGPDGQPLPPELGGGPGGVTGQVPAPPDGVGLLARLNVPAGPGGRLGSEVLQRGG
ncbi:MAG: hypothetical protein AAGA99_00615 [Actinomycetota bacterium]